MLMGRKAHEGVVETTPL